MESDGRLLLKHHLEARNDDSLKKDLLKKLGDSFEGSMVRGVSKFENGKCFPKLRIASSNYNFLVDGIHFKISVSGGIIQL